MTTRRAMLRTLPAAVGAALLVPPLLPAIEPAWRNLQLTIHPAEPGMLHVSLYTSQDGVDWTHWGDDAAYMSSRQEMLLPGMQVVYFPSTTSMLLNADERFVGLVADKWTRTDLLLLGPDGPLRVSPIIRDGPLLPVHSIFDPPPEPICYWDVSGAYGLLPPGRIG